jgi:uncharacterized protein with HEPN domain
MVKDDQVYLGHMLDTARKVLEKTSGVDRTQHVGSAVRTFSETTAVNPLVAQLEQIVRWNDWDSP